MIHSISIEVRRLGGGFGGKATRSCHVAAACAVASHVTLKPVRVTLDLETHMRMTGKRLPYHITYEVGVDDSGKILRFDAQIYCDAGFSPNEETTFLFLMNIQNCYDVETGWSVLVGRTLTNTPANTFCRYSRRSFLSNAA
jgi:xanthine dehydrogenase/oxidase